MNDMSSTIVAKSDQINAADLIGTNRTIVIKEVRIKAGDDQPVTVLIEGDKKGFRPCKGVRRLMVRVWGADASKYIGQAMTLFCDPSVTWAGKEEGGIRVSHMTGLDEEIVEYMRVSRAATKPYKIFPLVKQSAQTNALTLDQVRADIADAQSLDALATIWRSRVVAPFRDALQSDLDARKAALSAEGPSDSDRGEAHTGGTVDDAIARIEAAADADLLTIEQQYQANRPADTFDQDRIEQAIEDRKNALKGGE